MSSITQISKYGYEIYEKAISHLFYMNELQLYAKNDKELEGLLSILKQFGYDMGMEFGLNKCPKATSRKGKRRHKCC